MFTLTDDERLVLFEAGQRKLQEESAAHEARVAEEMENRIYQMGTPETPDQKLVRANNFCATNQWVNEEIRLTQAERGGLTESEFLKLKPETRLRFYNQAVHQRQSG